MLVNGTVTASTALIIPNAVSFSTSGSASAISNVTFAGSNITFTGAATTTTAGNNVTVAVSSGETVTFTGALERNIAAVSKQGTGTLVLAGLNLYTGVTNILSGIVNIQNNGATPLGAVATGTIVANGATLQLQQIGLAQLSTAEPLTVIGNGAAGTTGAIEMIGGGNSANTLSGTVALIGDTTIGVDVGQLTISGIISGAAGLTKVGLGMLSLGGANTYNGVTTISAGILEANVAAALGAITAGTVVSSGTTLDVAAVVVVGEQLTLSGTGFGSLVTGSSFVQSRGALLFTGAGTWNGKYQQHCRRGHQHQQRRRHRQRHHQRHQPDQAGLQRADPQCRQHLHRQSQRQRRHRGAGQRQHLHRHHDGGRWRRQWLDREQLRHHPEHDGPHRGQHGRQSDGGRQRHPVAQPPRRQHRHHAHRGHVAVQRQQRPGRDHDRDGGDHHAGRRPVHHPGGLRGRGGGGRDLRVHRHQLEPQHGATVNFVGGTNNATPLGTSSNELIFNNLVTTSSGTPGPINGGLQYLGNQGNILQYAEVNGLANNGDFATYTSLGIAPFSNYATQIFTSNGTLTASAGDIVKVLAQGSAAYTLQTTSNLSVGALLFVNATTTASAVTISVPNTLTFASGLVMFQGAAAERNIVGGQVNLGSEGIVFNNDTGAVSINTVVSGSNGLTLGGSGALPRWTCRRPTASRATPGSTPAP